MVDSVSAAIPKMWKDFKNFVLAKTGFRRHSDTGTRVKLIPGVEVWTDRHVREYGDIHEFKERIGVERVLLVMAHKQFYPLILEQIDCVRSNLYKGSKKNKEDCIAKKRIEVASRVEMEVLSHSTLAVSSLVSIIFILQNSTVF